MSDTIKIDSARAQSVVSGKFSGASFMMNVLGKQDSVTAKPKSQPAFANDQGAEDQGAGGRDTEDDNGKVPYGDERFVEGLVAQLGSA